MKSKLQLICIGLFLVNQSFGQPIIPNGASLVDVMAFISNQMYISQNSNCILFENENILETMGVRKFEYVDCTIDYKYIHLFRNNAEMVSNYSETKKHHFSLKEIKSINLHNNGQHDIIYLWLNKKIGEKEKIMMFFPQYLTDTIVKAFEQAVEMCGGKIEKSSRVN